MEKVKTAVTAIVKPITPAQPTTDTNAKPATVAPTPAPIIESDEVLKLRADKKAEYAKMTAAEFDTPEWLEAQMGMYKIDQLIKAQLANEIAAKKQLEMETKRNERIALLTIFEDLLKKQYVFESTTNHADADYVEKSNAINDEVKASREIVQNELLTRYAASTPSKSVATGATATPGTKGATGAKIRDMFITNRAAGMTDTDNVKAIIASGESRGTTGAVVLAYQREIGEKS